jgi:hypothetical protein
MTRSSPVRNRQGSSKLGLSWDSPASWASPVDLGGVAGTNLAIIALRVTALRAVLGLFTGHPAALFGLVCSYFSSLSPVNALAEALP